jgi:hypothetical protein
VFIQVQPALQPERARRALLAVEGRQIEEEAPVQFERFLLLCALPPRGGGVSLEGEEQGCGEEEHWERDTGLCREAQCSRGPCRMPGLLPAGCSPL